MPWSRTREFDPLARGGDDGVGRLAGDHPDMVGGVVDPRDLVAGVGHDEVAKRRLDGEDVLALDVAGVDHDVTAADQFVEDLAGFALPPRAYPE
jgi:hypothetical protein